MSDYFVYCHTPDNNDPDRRIQGLGFFGAPNGTVAQWLPIDTIIAFIDAGHRFFVRVRDVQTQVVVRQHAHYPYRRYLTTIADGYPPNNLLNLPHCPAL